jgi:hypothetical protein
VGLVQSRWFARASGVQISPRQRCCHESTIHVRPEENPSAAFLVADRKQVRA